jgi:hypothetical protein
MAAEVNLAILHVGFVIFAMTGKVKTEGAFEAPATILLSDRSVICYEHIIV